MKKKTAYIIDTYSFGSYHEVINQGLFMMVSHIYENVVYIAEKSAINNLKLLLQECHINYDGIKFESHNFSRIKIFHYKGLSYLLYLIKVSVLNYFYYMQTSKDSDVFYNNNIHFATVLFKYFSFYKKNRIYVICHSELEWIDPLKSQSLVERFVGRFYRFEFNCIKLSDRILYLLLSSDMADYFKTFVKKENQKNISWIDHCYIRPETNANVKKKDRDKISIGIPGAINKNRGLEALKELLYGLNNRNVQIYSISFITEELKSPNFEVLNKTGKLLPFEDYNKYINQMDAMLFLYNVGDYKLTASGAVLESIWNGKPIIALKNYYFEYLFRKFGPLGVLCDNVEDLINYINNSSIDTFERYTKNLQRAKEELMPYNIKKQLVRLL